MSHPIRVVRIIDRLNIGGPAKHVVWLTAGLNHGEFDSVLITGTVPTGEGDMQYFADGAGIRPIVLRNLSRAVALRDLLVITQLFRLFRRFRPDIVHTHKAKAGATGRIAAWLYRWLTFSTLWLRPRRCLVVHTFHGHIFHGYYGPAKTRVFLNIERVLARFATDRILTVSEEQRQEISTAYRIGRSEQFRVVPLGMDLSEMGEKSETGEKGEKGEACGMREKGGKSEKGERSEKREKGLREEFGIPAEVPLIGFVGRLCEVKNLHLFVEAANLLALGGVSAKFVLIGDGDLRPTLEAKVRSLSLEAVVLFAGFRRDVLSLYQDLDVVALTSVNEGTPLTLIEAMAAGRAIASTEVGGVRDIMGVRHRSCGTYTLWDHGITAPSCDPEAFADGLQYLLAHPELRVAMGVRGQKFVCRHHSKERLVRDMKSLYRELVP